MNLATDLSSYPQYEVPPEYSAAEWQARVELAACYRLVHHYGWTTLVYNHITARIPGTEDLLINPFGLMYDEITASGLVKIDIDGNKLCQSPHPINKAGYVIHSAVHKARPDIQCSLHTHSENAEALACVSTGFVPMTQTGCMFYERVGYHEFEGIALDEAERKSLIADLGNTNHTLILKNHGVLVCAPNIPWAISRLYNFEVACRSQLKAMATGAPLNVLSQAVMSRTRDQFESGDSAAGADVRLPEWPAWLRLLDRLDAGWRC